ncbi:uncharacterized protein VP01_13677g1, partial [Puccinia sorghi]
HIVHAFCEALIVSDSPSSANQLKQSSSKTRVSGRSKKYQPSDLEKERKRRLIQAKDAVNLVATSLLDLFVPLILDLSTSSLTPSSSTEYAASEVIAHLFKTWAKDLTPTSLPSTENDSREYSPRLANIWNVVRTPWVRLCRMV